MTNHELELNLVIKAQTGGKEAFAFLYGVYIKKIYNFIYYKTFSKETSEDLVSQVFLKALKNIGKFNGDNFSAWLYRIARNTVIDHYRVTKETINIEDCWGLAGDDNLTDNVDDNLKLEKIREALKKLSLADRELLIMRLWLDLPFKEIAASLAKSESAVKVSFGRALNRLRQKISATLFLVISLLIICKKLN